MAATASFGVVARVNRDVKQVTGVCFAIRSHLVTKLARLPKRLNDSLMVMQLQLTNKQKATLITAYATAITNPEEVKVQFY